ncbi:MULTISPECIES: hypothetical protein [Pseudonocardia]|nr:MULTISPECIES: hypothetical protein [Pseudonocardia]
MTASMAAPFGNVLGLMYSPHYLELLGRNPPETPGSRDAQD